ncbi:hypothetical protein AB5I41_23790 [Sphingomonas sp. MMS24-JH45]
MIDRYHLRYFLAVIDQGDFSRAADACNVSRHQFLRWASPARQDARPRAVPPHQPPRRADRRRGGAGRRARGGSRRDSRMPSARWRVRRWRAGYASGCCRRWRRRGSRRCSPTSPPGCRRAGSRSSRGASGTWPTGWRAGE